MIINHGHQYLSFRSETTPYTNNLTPSIFDLNGTDVPVELPGEGGISDGIVLPDEWSKSGYMNSNNWSMTWTIELPGTNLVGNETLTVHDTLGAGHQLCTPASVKVETVRGSTVVDVSSIAELDNVTTTLPQEFDIVLTAPEGGFDPNVTYQITYETCTPDGQIDPAGTTYDNNASVAIWGESKGSGVENHPWHAGVAKSGSVLGSADRNGLIAWTVTIDGDALVGNDSLTIEDTLGDGHEVTAETLENLTITERYGPSGQRDTDVTDLLAKSDDSWTANSFEATYTVPADDSFDFKASDYRYIIRYTTKVTQDDLPTGGTTYSNDALVNGFEATTNPEKVPDRSQGKSGSINTKARTLDGVEHLPQTTVQWRVRIPGEKLASLDGDLVLTDTLSDSHTVCVPGDPTGGLKAQLGFTFEAIDQINDGGLPTAQLGDSVTAAFDEESNELTFTIPQPELIQPDGTTTTGFSPEYQYLLSYTTCTTSGGMDGVGTVYGNDIEGAGIDWGTSATQNYSGSGTGQGTTRGSVAISKTIDESAPGADFVPDGTEFTVHVQEINPSGGVEVEYDLRVPANGDPISGFNARGRGWTIILTEPSFPNVPGVAFGDPVFTASENVVVEDGGKRAIAALTPGANIAVELTNQTELGAVSVEKDLVIEDDSIIGSDELPESYAVTAHINTDGLGDLVPDSWSEELTLVPGTPVIIDDLLIGAVVTFTEVTPATTDFLTWAAPLFSPESVTVAAGSDDNPTQVTVTNTVDRTTGTLSISKTVTGDQADNAAVPETVTVNATWNEEGVEGSKTLEVPTDGTSVPLGEDLLVGTEVTLTEVVPADGSSIAWGTPIWTVNGTVVDNAVVTIGQENAAIEIENVANTSTATISLIKAVSGEAADSVPSNAPSPSPRAGPMKRAKSSR
ncbi:MAG: DUF5979 domain-containing protein [Flaviflexus sp.]|uniref:DUF5979 domain-containing protein n=1 Tax=Flaviflexus sp. TaxID=1969482 RepID=UPI00352F7D4E